jgi:hypothetical protein
VDLTLEEIRALLDGDAGHPGHYHRAATKLHKAQEQLER